MRRMALFVVASCIAAWRPGPRGGAVGVGVAGRISMREKGGKPPRDLGAAVVYLEGAGPAARPMSVDVAISDKEFVPRVVVVPQGSTVRFPNHDPFNHNVFSAGEPNRFDLGLYGRGEAKGYALTSTGLVQVFCNIHPRMVAFVQVMATRYFTQPAADVSFALEDVAPGRYTLHVWHERSPQAVQELAVGPAGVSGLEIQLDARGFRWVPHKNKLGKDYPTDAGLERY